MGKKLKKLNFILSLVMILLIGFALRLTGTARQPLWTDEAISVWYIQDPAPSAILQNLSQDRHPPAYYFTLSVWRQLTGDSPLALRMLSVFFGMLTLSFMYRIAAETFSRTVRADRRDIAWYVVLLFTFLPIAIYYSRDIRHYGMLTMLVTLNAWLFVRILRNPRRWLLVAYAFSVAASLYTVYTAVIPLALQVFFGLALWGGNARRKWRATPYHKGILLLTWLGALLLFAPWLWVMYTQQAGFFGSGVLGAPGTFSSRLPDLLGLLGLLLGGGLALTGGLYAVGAWGTLVSDRTDVTLGLRFANPAWLAEFYLFMEGIGLFLLMALANNWVGLLAARTTVFLTPAMTQMVAAGMVRQRTGVRWSLILAYIVVSLFLPPVIQPHIDYAAAAQVVAAGYQPGDLVVLETGWDDRAFWYAIQAALGDAADTAQIVATLPWVDNRGENLPVVPQIEEQLRAAPRIWLVNWLQPTQVTPWLAENDAFTLAQSAMTDIGTEYQQERSWLYASNPVVSISLYEARP